MRTEVWSGIDAQIWRAGMQFTQLEAAKALGISHKTYNIIERRETVDRRTTLACLWLEHMARLVSADV